MRFRLSSGPTDAALVAPGFSPKAQGHLLISAFRPIAAYQARKLATALGGAAGAAGGPGTSAVPPDIISVDELASVLGLERKTVYALIARGKIPGVRRLGRRILVHRSTVVEWIAKGQGSARSGRHP